jgi:hypothetical protein
MDKPVGPILTLILGGLLLFGGGVAQKGGLPSLPSFTTISAPALEGNKLLLVYEKQSPTVDQVIALRDAPAFATEQKLDGFLAMDEEDPIVQTIIAEAAKKNLTPPLLVAAKVVDGKIVRLNRIRKWDKGLTDILK